MDFMDYYEVNSELISILAIYNAYSRNKTQIIEFLDF